MKSAAAPPLLVACMGLFAACGAEPRGGASAAGGEPSPLFREVGDEMGLDFTSSIAAAGAFALPEIIGSGAAVFDADGDGDLDIYLLDGAGGENGGAPNVLFLRQADGRYQRARDSGLEDSGFGTGVAVGDVDDDGDLDVYVGNVGADHLYLNDGKGHFAALGAASGIVESDWTASVAMVDYDLDGLLDLFVVHYVRFDGRISCSSRDGRRDYCSPNAFKGVADQLFRNLGNGRFEDVSAAAGIAKVSANGLGVIVDDFDGDGWPDVYVANDGEANNLWINQKDGRFVDEGLSLGCAVSGEGNAEASMGVACGDVDGDGDLDLYMTHLVEEGNTLYLGEGAAGFRDGSTRTGLHVPSLARTGFGTVMVDLDLDGDLDLAVVNGRVARGARLDGCREPEPWDRYAEPNQVYRNDGFGHFVDIGAAAGDFAAGIEVSRALVPFDMDGDGDLDLLVTNVAGRARLYENLSARRSFLEVECRDPSHPSAVQGARVTLLCGERRWSRTTGSSASFESSWMTALHFGLGDATAVDAVQVVWPGGSREVFGGASAGSRLRLERGKGKKP